MKLIYIAGPYRGDVDRNIQQVRQIAIALWEAGFAVIAPHLNTAHFNDDCKVADEVYLMGDLVILQRCDAVVLTPDWATSQGATDEFVFAVYHGIPTFVWPELPIRESSFVTTILSSINTSKKSAQAKRNSTPSTPGQKQQGRAWDVSRLSSQYR